MDDDGEEFVLFLCHVHKVPNPHGFTRHRKYSCSSISFHCNFTGYVTAWFGTKYSAFAPKLGK